ncbi:MAG: phytanoyl-CoA dioxygenase family protein [Chloroflexota bacterium]|nr:phytanoyl-CoA dioxygenase family protein [Chloroflexota bacterium]MDE2946053.1 phytanoyl-CoA dioxygenase family protein [Chloroflexota bacterium]
MQESTNRLSRAEVDFFVENGYLGPYAAMSPAEMAELRQEIDRHVLNRAGPNPRRPMQSRHMDNAAVYDLASHPAIIERIAGLLGPDLVVWTTNFWLKEPGAAEIPWHQDINFWPIEPPVNTSAWIAIDEVTAENACVRLIPGSHRQFLQHSRAPAEMAIAEMVDPDAYDEDLAVNMELKPGEFFLFSERLLHTSGENNSDKRRLGLSIRVTVPFAHIFQDSHLHPGHTAILASGKDVMGFNRYAGRPKSP